MSGSTSEGVQALVPDREKEASRSFVLTTVAARVNERGSVGLSTFLWRVAPFLPEDFACEARQMLLRIPRSLVTPAGGMA